MRRETHPYSPASGIAWTLRQLGEVVHPGEPIAELRDIWGRPLAAAGGDGLIRTEQEGWIIGFYSEVAVYRNSPIATLAVRDDEPLIAKWPDEGQSG